MGEDGAGRPSAEYGRLAVMIGSGGSIPVVEQIRRTLNIDALMMGFGLDDDQIHRLNEKFEMSCFHKGTRSHAILLGKLAENRRRAVPEYADCSVDAAPLPAISTQLALRMPSVVPFCAPASEVRLKELLHDGGNR
jgi:hypothetical protein